MKVELICYGCGGKRFINRSSSIRINRSFNKNKLVGLGAEKKRQTYECKKCGVDIDIIYYTPVAEKEKECPDGWCDGRCQEVAKGVKENV